MTTEIDPAYISYIKLGGGGSWNRLCLEQGEIHFGFRTTPHELCAAGDWKRVHQLLLEEGKTPGKAKDHLREVHDFYTLGADTLWITFADGYLWWAFADPEVIYLGPEEDGQGARKRRTLGPWRNSDLAGRPLRMSGLSSKLTQLAFYRQTLCRVKEEGYVLRRIRGEEEPILLQAQEARAGMLAAARSMIEALHWSDFETLVDLIFTRGGWQRTSRVGEDQADLDLAMEQPTIGERAFVQVKSRASQATLDEYLQRFRDSQGYDRFFFVCHSPRTNLARPKGDRLHVWEGETLAEAAVQAGLYDWLMEQTR